PGEDPSKPGTLYDSPFKDASYLADYLPILLDKATTTQNPEMPGRVNINMAPSTVLYCLPGLTTDLADTIVALRPPPDSITADPTYSTPAWLMTQAGLTSSQMKQLESYITTRSQ